MRLLMLLAALCAASALCVAAVRGASAQDAGATTPAASGQIYLPFVSDLALPAPSCRLGVNVTHVSVNAFDLPMLRNGWYIDYNASTSPLNRNVAEYVPVINLSEVGAGGYAAQPSGAALDAAIAANLGADWIIGNEPDRRYEQNDMTPPAYAAAYHDLYAYIKARDPSARIFAGAIVQPTPLRLQYLDLVLRSYADKYGTPLPADGWAIHNFILNERSCAHYRDLAICWGADIPPGIDAIDGLVIASDDLDKTVDVAFYKEQIVRFRTWMANNGYRNLPLYVSEYGVLMPESYGFPPSRVNGFMNQTFDYLLNARSDTLGYPADDNRLVQRLAWYSTKDTAFNGSLFETVNVNQPTYEPPFKLTEMGRNYRALADALPVNSDLRLLDVTQSPPAIGPGGGVTVTLKAQVANAGNNQWPAYATVRFFLGDPAAGGALLGMTGANLRGCGKTWTAQYVWPNVPPSAQGQYVYALLQAPGVAATARVRVSLAQASGAAAPDVLAAPAGRTSGKTDK
jgi:hypothetical protein